MRLVALKALIALLDPLLQAAPPFGQDGLPVCGSPQLAASGDQLLGRQAGELRAQRLVVRRELSPVALGGFPDVWDALA